MATTRLPCDVCGKRFKLDKYLKTHIKMQHSIEQPNFLCPKEGCSKTCTTPYNLKIHLIDQHNEAESDVDLESLKKLHVPKDQHTGKFQFKETILHSISCFRNQKNTNTHSFFFYYSCNAEKKSCQTNQNLPTLQETHQRYRQLE